MPYPENRQTLANHLPPGETEADIWQKYHALCVDPQTIHVESLVDLKEAINTSPEGTIISFDGKPPTIQPNQSDYISSKYGLINAQPTARHLLIDDQTQIPYLLGDIAQNNERVTGKVVVLWQDGIWPIQTP